MGDPGDRARSGWVIENNELYILQKKPAEMPRIISQRLGSFV